MRFWMRGVEISGYGDRVVVIEIGEGVVFGWGWGGVLVGIVGC